MYFDLEKKGYNDLILIILLRLQKILLRYLYGRAYEFDLILQLATLLSPIQN